MTNLTPVADAGTAGYSYLSGEERTEDRHEIEPDATQGSGPGVTIHPRPALFLLRNFHRAPSLAPDVHSTPAAAIISPHPP